MGRLVEPQRNRVHKDGQQEYLARSPYSFSQHPGEEFGALVSFLSENSNKMLPVTLDPHAYLDPDVVLSIDTRKAGSEAAVAHLVTQVWVRNPVVLFLETDVPQSHEMKAMLYHIGIVKKQLMFDVNKRADARVLRAVLKRLTWGRATPFALIGGRPFTMDELRMEKQQGTLASLLKTAAGKA
ncbi:hypothetical protein BKA62DRAFT_669385 [Auriculariales sp. MPI-PUGE-AT-0066]|nr:hypothetical protein BKA62DRAFT_669385 [Auriculariales sp. MPI-PUGE-AT-0066]